MQSRLFLYTSAILLIYLSSMLPRALFSASTLKSESRHQQTPSESEKQPTKRESEENSESVLLHRPSTSISNTTSTLNTISQLQEQLREQYAEQAKYQEKLNEVNQSIKNTSEKIARYAHILTQQSHREATRQPTGYLPEMTNSQLKNAEHQTKLQSKPAPNIQHYKHREANLVSKEKSKETPKLQLAKRSVPLPQINQNIFKKTKTEVLLKDIPWASKNTMDIYSLRARQSETVYSKRPRTLLYNIAQPWTEYISNLMVTTSLGGEAQFWNVKEKKKIKVIGKDYLYNGWIEDMCWLNSNTLAVCPSKGGGEPIKTIEISSVTNDDVKGNVHALGNSPHENGVSVISSLGPEENSDIGRIVTGGYDHKVFLWKVRRGDLSKEYNVDSIIQLKSRHTSGLSAFSHNSYNNSLVMGGQDERLSVLDVETNTILQTSRSKGRISQLIQNSQNPNIQLIVRQLPNEQFQIYDSREPEDKGTLLRFGQSEDENLSRYVKADLHKNGYMVICGSQKNPKLNFWDLRYTGVSKHVSFSMDVAISKTLNTLFIPEQNTVVTASALRSLDWLDYYVQKNEVIQEFEG